MLAFSIWNAIWVVFIWFLFINVLMMMFAVVADLFRDKEMSGVSKVIWILVLVMLPLIGLLIYVIARGDGMANRSAAQAAAAEESFESYVRDVAGGGAASELEKASSLHAAGSLSDDEYASLKSKILGG